jgi:hypothetical protein
MEMKEDEAECQSNFHNHGNESPLRILPSRHVAATAVGRLEADISLSPQPEVPNVGDDGPGSSEGATE